MSENKVPQPITRRTRPTGTTTREEELGHLGKVYRAIADLERSLARKAYGQALEDAQFLQFRIEPLYSAQEARDAAGAAVVDVAAFRRVRMESLQWGDARRENGPYAQPGGGR